jgi:hypothetical protein
MDVNQTTVSLKTLYNFEEMWKGILSGIVLVLSVLTMYQIFGQRSAFEQKRGESPRDVSNPYSKLDEKQLTERTQTFIKSMRSLNEDFRKAMNATSPHEVDSMLKKLGAVQDEYDRKFAAQARDLEKELLRRLPKEAAPKDPFSEIASSLIKNGRLAGADPAETIASYIEGLLAKLPHADPPGK